MKLWGRDASPCLCCLNLCCVLNTHCRESRLVYCGRVVLNSFCIYKMYPSLQPAYILIMIYINYIINVLDITIQKRYDIYISKMICILLIDINNGEEVIP